MVIVSRRIALSLSGDVDGVQEYEAAVNTDSPGQIVAYTISAGAEITFVDPAQFNGTTSTAVTIIKPSDYSGTLILKGSSDSLDAEGIRLHPTDPDTISLGVNTQNIVIKASAECTIRLIWT